MISQRNEAFEQVARELEETGEYRVLRRFRPLELDPVPPSKHAALGLVVDVETTGLSSDTDKIIELGLLPFYYDKRTASLIGRENSVSYLEDPGVAIPPAVTKLTGISDQDVSGRRIAESEVLPLIERAALVIAHNASFDRPFLERRIPAFEAKAWACSIRDVPWSDHGYPSTRLEYLLFKHRQEFFTGHRATDDCEATLQLLATPFDTARVPFVDLLESARRETVRIWAEGTSVEFSTTLKERGYRWNDGANGHPRAWYGDFDPSRELNEIGWLEELVYYAKPATWSREVFDAYKRYSKHY